MEILTLILLYYLSQNPEFTESVKPLMSQLKNSEQMLSFLNDLSRFSEAFSAKTTQEKPNDPKKEGHDTKPEEKKTPQSPTTGIADEYIQQILDGYLNKH